MRLSMRPSLAVSLALGVGATCFAVAGIAEWVAWHRQAGRMAAAADAALHAALDRLDHTLVLPAWNLDADQVRRVVEGELGPGSALVSAWVEMSPTDRLLAVRDGAGVRWAPAAAEPPPDGVLRLIPPPYPDRVAVGRIAVVRDGGALAQELRARRTESLLLAMVTGAASAVAAGLLTAHLVRRRLASLASSVASAPEGRLAGASGDRLDRIAQAAEAVLARLTEVLDAIGDGVITAGPDGVVLRVNPAAAALLPGPAQGRPLDTVLAELTGHPAAARDGTLDAHGLEWRQGDRVLLATRHAMPGAQAGSVVVIRDLTALRIADAELAAQRAQLREIIDHAPAAIFAKDPDGRLLFANRHLAELAGRPVHALVGQRDAELFPPEAAATYRIADRRVLDTGLPVEVEEPVQTPAGLRTYRSVKFPLRDAAGRIAAVCGIGVDITAAQDAERARQSLADRLRQAEKLQVIGQLAGSVAHDFNNTLAAIQGFAELLAGRVADPRHQEWCRRILTAARHGGVLTRGLLDYARRSETTHAPQGVAALLDETAGLAGRLVGSAVRLEVRPVDPGLIVLGDRAALANALLNLVINARDAMPGGGTITLAAELDGEAVVISVADTGTGMPPEVQARLFEPFFTTKEPGRGTGLGLASVKGAVQAHRGTIHVDSRPGEGTTFRLRLPRCAAGSPVPAAPPSSLGSGPGRLSGQRILVIDDEAGLRALLATALTDQGAVVVTAEDGTAGLARYADGPFDWVLLDMQMPGLDGAQVFAGLRARCPAQRVLVVSGYADAAALGEVIAAGAAGHLPKPFAIAELLDRLAPQGSPASP
jgi:two-component system cell cycle sensor histidine kinase/response regulator CckA